MQSYKRRNWEVYSWQRLLLVASCKFLLLLLITRFCLAIFINSLSGCNCCVLFSISAFAHGRNKPVDFFIFNLDTFFLIQDAIGCTLLLMGILSYIVRFCTFGFVLVYHLS